MSLKKIGVMFVYSLVGSLITTFAFTATSSGEFMVGFLALPAVAVVATIAGSVLGILLTPLMYWSLKDRNTDVVLPILYLLAFVLTALMTYLDPRVGFIGAFVYWISALVIIRFRGQAVNSRFREMSP